jgi:integrase
MAIFKRGRVYWYHFWFKDQHVQQSTRQGNPRVARQIEAAHRTVLAKGEVGIRERKSVPTLKDFAQKFIDSIQVRNANKPRTVDFYAQQLEVLLRFDPLASAQLDKINEQLIEAFVEQRSKEFCQPRSKKKRKPGGKIISPATVNRALATLRHLLRLAQEWQVIDRVPRIRLLAGEKNREFVLSHKDEVLYLEMAPQPLRDVATLILDTGLRMGEALALRWEDIHLKPANGARFGYLHVREGKSRFARRNIPLTTRARSVLEGRQSQSPSEWVFAEESVRPMLVSSLDHMHKKLRKTLKTPAEFVLHSLRHSYGTRLGEAGADAFAIMRLMGHSSVLVSQRYVHPTPEALERAVKRLETMNKTAKRNLPEAQIRQLPATVSATLKKEISVSH